jgi:hypothetical protein
MESPPSVDTGGPVSFSRCIPSFGGTPVQSSVAPVVGDTMRLRIAPQQIDRLINSDWEDPRGAIYVRDDLSVDEAEQSRFFRNARTLLNALNESGGTKATVGGNLNRKFVGEMMKQLDIPSETVEGIRRVNKVINEVDVWDLHITRVIVEFAGLIRQHGGQFKVIQKRSHLMEDEHAGILYALLLRTFFRKLNLAYLDRMLEIPLLDETVAFSLCMASMLLLDWREVEEVSTQLLVLEAWREIPHSPYSDNTPYVVYRRILKPLIEFALLEERRMGDHFEDAELKKTDLFDRVLKFDVEVNLLPGYLH